MEKNDNNNPNKESFVEFKFKSKGIPAVTTPDIRTLDHVNERMIKTAMRLLINKNLKDSSHRPLTFNKILNSVKMKAETEQASKMLRAYIETWLGKGTMVLIPKHYLDEYGIKEAELPSFMAASDKITTPRIVGKQRASDPKVIRLLGLDPRKLPAPEDR